MPRQPGWMHVAMSHGAGDVAVMRELDWGGRHACPPVLLFLFIAVCDLFLPTVAQVLRGPRQAQSLLGCAPGGGAQHDGP